MYRLVVVEDEDVEREGLRDLVDWGALGVELAGVYDCAEEALSSALEAPYDILLSDIRLFGMSGLELAARMKEISPGLRVVFTSGYHEFEYARTALDLEAVGFIPKPVDMAELERVFRKTVSVLDAEEAERRERAELVDTLERARPVLRARFLEAWVEGTLGEEELAAELEFHTGLEAGRPFWTVLLVAMDGFDEFRTRSTPEVVHGVEARMGERLAPVVDARFPGSAFVVHAGPGRHPVVIHREAGDAAPQPGGLAELLRAEARRVYAPGVSVVVGPEVGRAAEVCRSYEAATVALSSRFYVGDGQVIDAADAEGPVPLDEPVRIEPALRSLVCAMDARDVDRARSVTEAFFGDLSGRMIDRERAMEACIALVSSFVVAAGARGYSYLRPEAGSRSALCALGAAETLDAMARIAVELIAETVGALRDRSVGRHQRIVAEIRSVIEERYNRNLTVQEAAREVLLSPNYVSAIFKRETGQSFTEYLQRTRMEKARALLEDPCLRVADVGFMVGYSNISHFCGVFRETYGMSPNEYREKR